MLYQIALNLHKLKNDHENAPSFEIVTVMDQIVCTCRQIDFKVFKNCNSKIGMNTTANKLYHLNDMVGLNV